MDAISDPAAETVVIMSASQVGKTEVANNIVGYHIDQDPAPILVVQPTLEMAQAWSKDRLAPMLRDTPALRGKVKDPRSRDSGNTTLHKIFPGGHITACGANSPASLASRPVRIVLCDEVDRYPVSAGAEGDPVNLAQKRATTFWNRKKVLTSTPTIRKLSRIEAAYEASDQRIFLVPCPDCDHEQRLVWSQVRWENGDPTTARYVCVECGSAWDDTMRHRAVRRGRWMAQAPFTGIAGFHLSGIYSPWIPLGEAATDFIQSKKRPDTLRVWVNTYLGETWEDEGEGIDDQDLVSRVEDWGDELPEEVVIITAGVDVQDDRLEVEIVGWGRDEETWSLEYKTIWGDPSAAAVWQDLDLLLRSTWHHAGGFDLPVRAACIDSGGHHTQAVYRFVKSREGRRIVAIKGMAGEGRAIVGRPSKNNIGKVRLFPIGVDTAKEQIYSRLKIRDAGPGYCHFPVGRDEEYFRQLTAEQMVTKFHKGFQRREWVKTRTRNEALDCRVYAVGAFALLNTNINLVASRMKAKMQAAAEETSPEEESPQDEPKRRKRGSRPKKRGGFVGGWR